MSKAKSFIIIVITLAISFCIAAALILNPEEAKQRPKQKQVVTVEAIKAEPTNHTIKLFSTGTVTPFQQTIITAEVGGTVKKISARFRDGMAVKKNDILYQLDATDYEVAVENAKADLAQAELNLSQEKVTSEQAKRNWLRHSKTNQAPSLVLRKPQMKLAEAKLAAAKSQLRLATLNLSRTTYRAPYDGIISLRSIDVGQYVNRNQSIGQIYASHRYEVSVALTSLQRSKLMESIESTPAENLTCKINYIIGNNKHSRNATFSRLSSTIDSNTRQDMAIIEIDKPHSTHASKAIKIGQFIEVEIHAQTLENVLTVAYESINTNNEIYLLDKENKVIRHNATVLWKSLNEVVLKSDLPKETRIITVASQLVTPGTIVQTTQNHAKTKDDPKEKNKEMGNSKGKTKK